MERGRSVLRSVVGSIYIATGAGSISAVTSVLGVVVGGLVRRGGGG